MERPFRTLNDPVGCMFSCFTQSEAPGTAASSCGYARSGVGVRNGVSRARAAFTSSSEMGDVMVQDVRFPRWNSQRTGAMGNYAYVAIGSALGAVERFTLGGWALLPVPG